MKENYKMSLLDIFECLQTWSVLGSDVILKSGAVMRNVFAVMTRPLPGPDPLLGIGTMLGPDVDVQVIFIFLRISANVADPFVHLGPVIVLLLDLSGFRICDQLDGRR